MSDVGRDLANYRYFVTEQRTPEEDRFYYRTDVMQVGVITPVLLLLLSAEHQARIRAFDALESFLVRRMICRQTTKDYNRLTLDLAVKLRDSGLERADIVVANFLKEQTAYSREWPNDENVATSLESSPLYRLLTRGRLRLVLEGIEESRRRSTRAEQPEVPKNLTIEHVMPLSWEANWPLPKCVDVGIAKENRNRIVHTIGNLALVTQKLNSSMSNAPWECKRKALKEHSVMNLNSELNEKQYWEEESIRDRSKQMAKLVAEHWPGPDSNSWT